ncbi:hypothetical protein [Ravibacter arvi]|uniref:hypothetical protein n=1 Tax=Ravibacter arvi TaxID=2051041 RepID=UPI0031EB3414
MNEPVFSARLPLHHHLTTIDVQKKILSFALTLMTAGSLQLNAQYARQDSAYKKYFVGSTFLMLGNLIPDDPNPPHFIQLNVGYRITPKDVVFLELKRSRFAYPLGTPGENHLMHREKTIQGMYARMYLDWLITVFGGKGYIPPFMQ